MQSANTLLNRTSSKTVQNVPTTDRNPLYNPSTPVMNDENLKTNIKALRSVRMQDRYYTDMVLNSITKNGDGFTMGSNNKGLSFFENYDRAIDPNLIARRKADNKKYTQPDDFYNGSVGAYYSIPKTIARPQAITPDVTSLTDSMNAYQYKNSSIAGGLPVPVSIQKPAILPDQNAPSDILGLPQDTKIRGMDDAFRYGGNTKPSDIFDNTESNARMMNDVNTTSYDPTTDPAYLKYLDELKKSRMNAAGDSAARENQKNIYKKYGLDTKTDENGLPAIRAPTRIGISDIG